jgi:hypothetical protein
MTARASTINTRRVQTKVSPHTRARLDRVAEAYRREQVPGGPIGIGVVLRATVHVGLDAEEKRLGLPPLPEPSAPSGPAPARPGSAARADGGRARRGR